MNTGSNALPEAAVQSPVAASAAIPAGRRFYWSVRRELWENRSIYLAPAAAGALILLGSVITVTRLPRTMQAMSGLDPMKQHQMIEQHYLFASYLLMAVALIVAVFYCLDCLYGERRDRSILFWKSLPVSDTTAVLSKASVPLVLLPFVTFVITVATQWIMFLMSSAVLLARGMSVATLWSHLGLLQMWGMLFYHLMGFHGLWYAPFFGWMILVSAWARRAPFLWAILPPLIIGIVEKIAFNTTHFAYLVGTRFVGGREGAAASTSMDMLNPINFGQFLISPGLWIGLAITAVFLALAIRLRRSEGPI